MATVEVESSLQQQAAGSHAQSVESLSEVLRIRERRLAPDDPEIGRTLTALGFAHQRAFDYAKAVDAIGRALDATPERYLLQTHLD